MARHFVVLKLNGTVLEAPVIPDAIQDYMKNNKHWPAFIIKTNPLVRSPNYWYNQYWAAKFKFKNPQQALSFSLKFGEYFVKSYAS